MPNNSGRAKTPEHVKKRYQQYKQRAIAAAKKGNINEVRQYTTAMRVMPVGAGGADIAAIWDTFIATATEQKESATNAGE